MSLILDALRKSEAERRRGQAPGLHTGMPVTPVPRPSAWRHAPILAGGVLVLVAVALLFARNDPGAHATDAAVAADVGDRIPPPAAEPSVVLAPTPAARPPASRPAPPPPPPPPLPTEPRTEPSTTASRPAAPVPPSASTATPTTSAMPAGHPPKPPAEASPAVASARVEPPAAPATAADPGPTAVGDDSLPPLAILSPGERAALPPLKLSMHVFNEQAARRFAIVDGQRVVEGAQLGGAIVTRIRRDGVELDVNGRRVLLPRP